MPFARRKAACSWCDKCILYYFNSFSGIPSLDPVKGKSHILIVNFYNVFTDDRYAAAKIMSCRNNLFSFIFLDWDA